MWRFVRTVGTLAVCLRGLGSFKNRHCIDGKGEDWEIVSGVRVRWSWGSRAVLLGTHGGKHVCNDVCRGLASERAERLGVKTLPPMPLKKLQKGVGLTLGVRKKC